MRELYTSDEVGEIVKSIDGVRNLFLRNYRWGIKNKNSSVAENSSLSCKYLEKAFDLQGFYSLDFHKAWAKLDEKYSKKSISEWVKGSRSYTSKEIDKIVGFMGHIRNLFLRNYRWGIESENDSLAGNSSLSCSLLEQAFLLQDFFSLNFHRASKNLDKEYLQKEGSFWPHKSRAYYKERNLKAIVSNGD